MRDWTQTLRRASFRGVPFWVETAGRTAGRRVAVHLISGGEAAPTEDMGRIAGEFSVMAYHASDAADVESAALAAVADAFGPGLLMLPINPGVMVHCLVCEPEFERDRMGYVGTRLTFVRAGALAVPLASGLTALRAEFSVGIGPVSASLGASLSLGGLAVGGGIGVGL